MYEVSDKYKQAIRSHSRKSEWRGTITTTAGIVYHFTNKEIVKGSGTLTRSCAGSTSLELGSVYAAELDISLFLNVDRYSMYDAVIDLYYVSYFRTKRRWNDLISSTWNSMRSTTWTAPYETEEIPMGRFVVSEATRTLTILQLKAYDYMLRFDKSLVNSGNTRTPYEWLQFACEACRVPLGITEEAVAAMPNGTKSLSWTNIDEDKTYDYEGRYSVAVAPADKPDFIQAGFHTAKLHMNREPRFYADIAFDGSYWWGNGTFTGAGWKIGTRQGDPAGKTQSVRYTITGYWNKKGNNYQTTVTSSGGAQTYNFSPAILRLADLYLLYAEARNESLSQPDDEVYAYVDKVREHAGLSGVVESWENFSTVPNKPQTKEGMREIIHRERDVELCFESKHFWDVRRWKTAMQEVPGSIIGWNIDANSDDEYYTIKVLDNLTFTTKEYLWPIRTYTLRVNTNLVQNPYWE